VKLALYRFDKIIILHVHSIYLPKANQRTVSFNYFLDQLHTPCMLNLNLDSPVYPLSLLCSILYTAEPTRNYQNYVHHLDPSIDKFYIQTWIGPIECILLDMTISPSESLLDECNCTVGRSMCVY